MSAVMTHHTYIAVFLERCMPRETTNDWFKESRLEVRWTNVNVTIERVVEWFSYGDARIKLTGIDRSKIIIRHSQLCALSVAAEKQEYIRNIRLFSYQSSIMPLTNLAYASIKFL